MFNNALLMAAAASGDSLVQVGNSALFDASASTDGLSYTTDGSGFNQKTFTLSTWFYLGSDTSSIGGVGWPIFASDHGSANSETTWWKVRINTNGTLVISNWNDVTTTQVFRDIGWYNLVIGADTTQAIASNRYKVYVNGEIITSFSSTGYPSQNIDLAWGEPSEDHWIGNYDNANYAYNGYLAETVFKSGSQLGPESFGEFDSTGTFWTPLSSTSILAGSPTFYLDNATNPQTDASGNGNNFTNNGSITLSTNTPTNINTLMNPLSMFQGMSLANGNNKVTFTAAAYTGNIFTIPIPPTGKWKMEVDMTAITGGLIRMGIIEKTEYSPKNMTTNVPFDHDNFGNPDFNTISTSQGNASAIGKIDGTAYSYASEANGSRVVSNGDRWAFYYDADSGKFWAANDDGSGDTTYFYEDSGGTAGNPATGSNPLATSNTSKSYQFYVTGYSDPTANRNFLFKEEADWILTTPTGYAPLTTANIASATTRTKSNLEEYFDTTLYEGNGAGQRVGKFLPFTNSFTVGKGALFVNANSEDLSRGSMSGTATTFTISMWVKRAEPAVGSATANFMFTTASDAGLAFGNNSTADVLAWYSGSYTSTTRVFSDQSQWMNVVLKSSSGTGTAYVNGVEMLSSLTVNGADATMAIGSYNNSSNFFDGYMAEVVMIDGTALEPSSFGQVDTSTGRWIPKDVSGLTFGTNGFYLNFAASDDVGNDVSGNNNDFTNNNTVVQVADTPTVNIATLDSNRSGGGTISNGNKTLVTTGSSDKSTQSTIRLPNTGKYYWESNLNVASSGSIGHIIALNNSTQALTTGNTAWTDTVLMNRTNSGSVKVNGSDLFTFSGTASTNDKFQVAVDLDNNKMWFGINNSFFNATGGTDGNPSTGANAMIVQDFAGYFPMFGNFNTQQTVRFDSADWTYTPPTDYVSLTQDSLPTGESYQTAFSWIKNRDAADNHMLFDRVRGIYKDIHSNTQDAEVTNVNTLQRFLNGGVQVGNDVQVNTASESYVAWNWYMETAGTGSSNTDGTINTTSTLVDTNLGMSISTYTGTGANATIGHGLGVVPEFFMVTRLDSGNDKMIYHSALGATKNLVLNNNGTGSTSITRWNNTEPTSSVISLGTTAAVNGSSATYICYAFAPSQFTAIGSYLGNGNANGTFVPTVNSLGIPLKVQWVMIKRSDADNSWQLTDTVRTPNNASSLILQAQLSNAELDNSDMDNLTGGFKLRATDSIFNNSSGTYVYLAFGTPLIDVDGRIITGR